MVLVILLSLTVGWMVGRSSRKPIKVVSHATPVVTPSIPDAQEREAQPQLSTEQPAPLTTAPLSSESPNPTAGSPNPTTESSVQTGDLANGASPQGSFAQVTVEDRRPVSKSTREKLQSSTKSAASLPVPAPQLPGPKNTANPTNPKQENSPDSLVVFENKKLIAQSRRPKRSPQPVTTPGSKMTIAALAAKGSSDASPAVVLSEMIARQYLVRKVEPVYPQAAKQQRIQGGVLVNLIVGKDGSVEGVDQVSGDPQLMRAAADAIRQWHFRPYLQNGQPVKFQSRMYLNFALP
jgi:TonB family protein